MCWAALRSILPCIVASSGRSPPPLPAGCEDGGDGGAGWAVVREAMWLCLDAPGGKLRCETLARQLRARQDGMSSCEAGELAAAVIEVAHGSDEEKRTARGFQLPFQAGLSIVQLVTSGFPVFGALDLLGAEVSSGEGDELPCADHHSRDFHAVLWHHLQASTSIPSLPAMEYLGTASAQMLCPLGQAAGLLSLALATVADVDVRSSHDLEQFLERAEGFLREGSASLLSAHRWLIWLLLHRIAYMLEHRGAPEEPLGGCIIMIYAFPTDEIRNDTAEAVRLLEKYFFAPLNVSYPLVVFTDLATAPRLENELGPLLSAKVVPAVIPAEELLRKMSSFSCVDGLDCATGRELNSSAHRGSVNSTQFWSPDYLRISRYTAGPLFLHPALDSCGLFLKIDADFFLTAPLHQDPIAEMQREGTRLAHWQIHVQGQRQRGYMDAAMAFLGDRGLPIRSRAFYARGRFTEKAESLGIPVSEVPEAMEAATVVYGCLFGGDVRLFREPLYRDFFSFMDERRGFEENGWSNQFFLGTTAAAFLYPSQIRRLYISGWHQESRISIADGNVTEFLLGSSKGVFR